MEFRTIRQTSHIDGVNRNPDSREHNKAMLWDDDSKNVKYVLIAGLDPNSKTNDGFVTKGSDSASASYVWKLDSSKNPGWRQEEYLNTITRVSNTAVFTMTSGATRTLGIGELAWEDFLVASQVVGAFDKSIDDLDDIAAGVINKHFTATYKTNVDLNTSARHTHSNKAILDGITNLGSGKIITDYERSLIYSHVGNDAEFIRDTTASFIKDGIGISWIHDDPNDTFTPTVALASFSTDDLSEGVVNEYYTTDKVRADISVVEPTPGLDSLVYDNLTGVLTHNPATVSAVRATISATYPVQYAPASGVISIDTSYFSGLTSIPEIKQVSQVLHGFAENDAIRLDSGTSIWVKALADSSANAGTIGVVKTILSPNVFTYQYAGIIERNPNPWTLGAPYFLSNATSGLITTEPTYTIGQVRQYIGTGVAEGLLLEIDLGHEITAFELPDYPSGTVTSIIAGDGMNFTEIVGVGSVVMGTPSSVSWDSVNVAGLHTHSHAMENSGAVAGTYTNPTIVVNAKGLVESAANGTPMSNTVSTDHSISGNGSIGNPIQLVNDQATPDPTSYYGTNEFGVLGFYSVVPIIGSNYPDPEYIPFTSDSPSIADYSIYLAVYGGYPSVELYTIDEFSNRIKRTENPYFVMNGGVIESINFGTLSDGSQTGFIILRR